MINFNTIKPITDIDNFTNVYYNTYFEVYDSRHKEVFIAESKEGLKACFEQEYNVELIEVKGFQNHPSMLLDDVNAIDFKTEENMTMCMLKWGWIQ